MGVEGSWGVGAALEPLLGAADCPREPSRIAPLSRFSRLPRGTVRPVCFLFVAEEMGLQQCWRQAPQDLTGQ